jgi:tetratricopeptide (TPR) repeat protein
MGTPEGGIPRLESSVEFGRSLDEAGHEVAEELAEQVIHLADAVQERDPDRATALWAEANVLLERVPLGVSHVLAAVNYSAHLERTDQLYVALTYLEEAFEIGAGVGVPAQRMHDLTMRLARLLRKMNRHKRAGDYLIEQFEMTGDPWAQDEIISNAVDCYFEGAFWSKMKSACGLLRDLRREASPRERYDAAMRYSIACRGLGEVDESLQTLGEALDHAIAFGDPGAILAARGQTAIMRLERGDYAGAARLALEIWAQGNRDLLTARTLVKALLDAGEIDRAIEIRDEFARSGGDELGVAYLSAYLADAGVGDPIDAWYQVGVHGKRDRAVEVEALSRLFEMHSPGSSDRYEVAKARLRLIDHARTQVTDLFSESSWQSVTPYAKDFASYLDSYIEEAITDSARGGDAIYELERFRSQMLVDVLSERTELWRHGALERGRIKSQLTSEYQRARYRFNGLEALGVSWSLRRDAARDVERLRGSALTAGGHLHIAPGFQGARFPVNLEEHLEGAALAAGELIVFLHTLSERTALWARDGSSQISQTSIPNFGARTVVGVQEAIRQYELDPDVGWEDMVAAMDDLEQVVARPLTRWLQDLEARRVFIVAGTSVTNLPIDRCPSALASGIDFCFLPTGGALGFTRTVRHPLPMNHYIVAQDRRDAYAVRRMTEVRGKALLVVDPTRTLRFAPMEAAVVVQSLSGRDVTVLDQAEVAKEDIRRAAGRVEILHLIGHGTFDDQSPYRSGMYLNRAMDADALWTNAEIFSDVEAVAGRVAVLSGCETARTRPNLVSEEVSLPAALVAAGYSAVIGSRWPVDDLSTTLLMNTFYERWLVGGMSLAKALSDSSTWLRDLGRDEAVTLVGSLPERLGTALPDRQEELAAISRDAVASLRDAEERPFEYPDLWAAFYVVGDGSITADGTDRRMPTSSVDEEHVHDGGSRTQ